jgi:hypothetical protein
MKQFIVIAVLLSAAGCGVEPMSPAAAAAISSCIEKGWTPRYHSTATIITVYCVEK